MTAERNITTVIIFYTVFIGFVSFPSFAFSSGNFPSIEQGLFLIADPSLRDQNFKKTVVLLWEHGDAGTNGVVINRPTQTSLSNVLPMISEFSNIDLPVYIGGPVRRLLPIILFRHFKRPPIGHHVLEDIYISTNFDVLKESPEAPWSEKRFRVYSGYSGWSPGQLEAEMAQGVWHLIRGNAYHIFDTDPNDLWSVLYTASQAIQIYNRAPYNRGLF